MFEDGDFFEYFSNSNVGEVQFFGAYVVVFNEGTWKSQPFFFGRKFHTIAKVRNVLVTK